MTSAAKTVGEKAIWMATANRKISALLMSTIRRICFFESVKIDLLLMRE